MIEKNDNGKAKKRIPWNKGKIGVYSKGTLEKMRDAKKGRVLSEEHKQKIGFSLKGHKPWGRIEQTEETKKKIAKSMKGKNIWMKGRKHTEEQKRKISETMIGRKASYSMTLKIKEKISDSLKIYYLNRKGTLYGRIGENHPAWQGGVSKLPYGCEFNRKLKKIIKIRDEFECSLCGVKENENLSTLHIHHIDYDKLNNKQDNLITICVACHAKTNHKREYWESYFKKLRGGKDGTNNR